MSLDFLREHGARRVRGDAPQPLLLGDGVPLSEPDDEADTVAWDYEMPAQSWRPRQTASGTTAGDESNDARAFGIWPQRPRRFIDGKDSGRTVAWLRAPQGYPVPIRLSEIGAVALRAIEQDGAPDVLRREWNRVERVVSLMIDFFPWDEIELFACELARRGFRLLPVEIPRPSLERPALNLFDFERMRQATYNRSLREMQRLEREALGRAPDVPVIVDGELKTHAGAFDAANAPVVGVIKSHSTNYLHPQGWQTFHDLRPGERTPAFARQSEHLSLVTWYLRLSEARDNPNQGVVRVEMARERFEGAQSGDFSHLDAISRGLRRLRCRDEGYGRAAVSLAPIVRAEASLGALFTSPDVLTSRFYHLTGL